MKIKSGKIPTTQLEVSSLPIVDFLSEIEEVWSEFDEDEQRIVEVFLSHWKGLKKAILEQYRIEDIKKKAITDLYIFSEDEHGERGMQMDFANTLIGMNMHLANTNRKAERIAFLKDLLDLFVWSEEDEKKLQQEYDEARNSALSIS